MQKRVLPPEKETVTLGRTPHELMAGLQFR